MRIVSNESEWIGADVARIVRRALKQTRLTAEQRKAMRVTLKTRHARTARMKNWVGGSAPYGVMRMTLKLPPISNGPLDLEDLAATVVHEAWHCLGIKHDDMPEHILYSHKTKLGEPERLYGWTALWAVRARKPRVRTIDPVAQAARRVATWEKKLARAERALAVWRRRLKARERTAEKRGGAPVVKRLKKKRATRRRKPRDGDPGPKGLRELLTFKGGR